MGYARWRTSLEPKTSAQDSCSGVKDYRPWGAALHNGAELRQYKI